MSPKHREVDPKDFKHITYRGVGLAAFTPNPKIKWHSPAKKTSAAPSTSAAGRKAQAG